MANSSSAPRNTAILYQNPQKTITLLDIPTSITLAAQGSDHNDRVIYSVAPPQAPYPSTEPKSEKAKANVMRAMGSSRTTAIECPAMLLRDALEEVKKYHRGCYCLSRRAAQFRPSSRGAEKKRKFEDGEAPVDSLMISLTEPSIQIPTFHSRWRGGRTTSTRNPLALSQSHVKHFPDVGAVAYRLIHNSYFTPLSLSIGPAAQTYSISPKSAFYLANIDESSVSDFSIAAQSFLSTPTASAGPGQFDFILLDPPWNNRSVKRSGEYTTVRHRQNPMLALQDVLGKHIAPRGLVACWITNKEYARECALAAFDSWGVNLVEEWTWLKTTADGLPVTDIEGLWRKPYEIVLIGRQADSSGGGGESTTILHREVIKRTIIAVPDLHSRKPCLKELIEPLMPNSADYRALEVFARNLTAGWWSWGNEAIKYNWQGYWHRYDSNE
ncbi:hypothetical protein MMC07_008468 [Pseudocyphellaria aurata]|nr:hypothetical protein [Pseudocyphellaria aurata]